VAPRLPGAGLGASGGQPASAARRGENRVSLASPAARRATDGTAFGSRDAADSD